MASYPLTRGSKSAPGADVLSNALIVVLEGHNAALKANVERLEAHNAALKADIKNLKAKLAAERERAVEAFAVRFRNGRSWRTRSVQPTAASSATSPVQQEAESAASAGFS
jgi:hypothetical protein